MASTNGAARRRRGRVRAMPSGTATRITTTVDQKAIDRCSWIWGTSFTSQSRALRCWMVALARSRPW